MKQPVKPSLRPVPSIGITLLAIALGGTTGLGAQAVIVLLAAFVIFRYPPRAALGMEPAILVMLFLGLALAAFLPEVFGVPEWRRHLTDDLHVPLGTLRTPQPWLTLQACGLLLFGLVWMYYLFSQEWSLAEKSQALRLLTSGIVVLAAASIVAHVTGLRIPGWTEEQNRGWFPNRNQTADVLALAGVVNYAIVFKRFEKKKWTGFVWLAGLVIICAALVISYSRAGVVMFFGGIALWHLGAIFQPGETKKLALGLSFLLLLLSLFLLFGGTTLDRFMSTGGKPDLASAPEYRTLIQEDAVRVSLQAPFLGAGLGNFEPVFTSMRQASADQNRTIHPESDWLWMAVEMGWIAPLLILFGLRWWLKKCLPLTRNAGESMRRVALVAFVLFLGHGMVDVSGHRPGSLLVGLLLGGIALAPVRESARRLWIAPLFRSLALVLALLGTWWLISSLADVGPPTTATLDRMQARINEAAGNGKIATMGEIAEAGLDIAPLNWGFYFRRASAEAFRTGAIDQAASDFKIARFLQPNWIDICLNEGEVWMAVDQPDLCVDAWREALRRAGPNETNDYETMLRLAADSPAIHQGLKEASTTNNDYLIAFLQYATPDEVKDGVDALLARDPALQTLTTAQQQKFFSAWYARGDRDALAQALLDHADWQVAGWSFLVRHFADRQDFEMASLTALKFMPPPAPLPAVDKSGGGSDGKIFEAHPDDVVEGLLLCRSQIDAGRIDDALSTIAKLEKLKDCPAYVYYYEAQLDVKEKAWQPAWNAVRQFGGM